jgi:peptide/nickel transport system permease protein
MLGYTLRALALTLLALLLADFVGFAYAHTVAPIQAQRSPLYASRAGGGPLLADYRDHLAGAARLNLGPLPGGDGKRSVVAALGAAGLNSLGLLALALCLGVIAGAGLGLASVRPDPPRVAAWLSAAATVGLATPSFFFGVLGVTAVIMFLIWAPGQPVLLPLQGYGWDRHLVLPVVALMLRPTAQIAQITAGALAAELRQQYVVTARSFGNPEGRIVRRHALRNALPTIISTVAASLRLVAGELVVVESLFAWPGLGRLVAQTLIPANSSVAPEAALFLSPPLIAGAVTLFAALFLLANLAASLLARAIDPRLREV